MFSYFEFDIIPILLNRFKVNDIIIVGNLDEKTKNFILNYCNDFNANYTFFDVDNSGNTKFRKNSIFNDLSNFKNYGAIFLNDDPNWYTTYNELKIIKENNDDFPLVFICNNTFPHKRRDSYENPTIIPNDFLNDYSEDLKCGNISIYDGFYHAIESNTSKNGVLTAIDDFLGDNYGIEFMNIKFLNGMSILYHNNPISYFRLKRLAEEISEFSLECGDISDKVNEIKLLSNYISDISKNSKQTLDDYEIRIIENEKLINEYEDKIKIFNSELNYKNSRINAFNSKLNLKDSQINNVKSKLINRENDVASLQCKVEEMDKKINSLEYELNEKKGILQNKENEIDFLSKELDDVNNQIKINEDKLNNSDKDISEIKSYLSKKEDDLNAKEGELDSIKRKYFNQLSTLDKNEYCIKCYEEEINNNHLEINYLKNTNTFKKILSPFSYLYLFIKSNPRDAYLNFKLYKVLKNSNCFDIGYYLNNNVDLQKSKWCKYFSPELHYVCRGFRENRKFNKKYFNRNSKEELLDYILNCND